MDVFYRTAAYEFSSSFFKVRGLDSDNAIVQINGIKMNKLYNGRPQWSNWGGLNDVLRNQELSNGSIPLKYNFGGILGSNNINVRASEYGQGGRITYSSSNRSYANRLMATYNSGMLPKGWAYSLSIGRRWGNEGYQDASFYDSNSAFLSVQKIFNSKHSINLAAIYAPNRRGKVSPNTQEVYDLKGTKYNEYWGWQDGEKRNSRVKRVVEPIVILNHDWIIDENSSLETSIGFQFGEMGNSRLDYAGGSNPSPAYYQDLPSYFLADNDGPDYEGAYIAQENFVNSDEIARINPCGHIFTRIHLNRYLRNFDYRCPICRRDLRRENDVENPPPSTTNLIDVSNTVVNPTNRTSHQTRSIINNAVESVTNALMNNITSQITNDPSRNSFVAEYSFLLPQFNTTNSTSTADLDIHDYLGIPLSNRTIQTPLPPLPEDDDSDMPELMDELSDAEDL